MKVTGTLGVLIEAHNAGLLNFDETLEKTPLYEFQSVRRSEFDLCESGFSEPLSAGNGRDQINLIAILQYLIRLDVAAVDHQ